MAYSHVDVVTAFGKGQLQETIYMYQPPGYKISVSEHLVCHLRCSAYAWA